VAVLRARCQRDLNFVALPALFLEGMPLRNDSELLASLLLGSRKTFELGVLIVLATAAFDARAVPSITGVTRPPVYTLPTSPLVDPDAVVVAATLGDAVSLALYIAAGADVNARAFGFLAYFTFTTPLTAACSSGCLPCVKMLIKNGADVNREDGVGGTVPHLQSPLEAALNPLAGDSAPSIIRALAAAGARLLPANGRYPLHSAILLNSVRLARALIETGADIGERVTHEAPMVPGRHQESLPAQCGWTLSPRDYARALGHDAVEDYLAGAGAPESTHEVLLDCELDRASYVRPSFWEL
jgi:ankyrin repeat protein